MVYVCVIYPGCYSLSFLDLWFCVSLILKNSQSLLLLPHSLCLPSDISIMCMLLDFFDVLSLVLNILFIFSSFLVFVFQFWSFLLIYVKLHGFFSSATWSLLIRLGKTFFFSFSVFHLQHCHLVLLSISVDITHLIMHVVHLFL